MRKTRWFFAFVLLVASASPLVGQAATLPGLKADCFEEHQPVTWNYCVYTRPESKNRDLLYYFHGIMLDEKSWNDDRYWTGMIQKQWLSDGLDAPTVVSVSLGKIWFLAEKNARPASGLYELMRDDIIPTIEGRLSGAFARRLIVADSMGGMNALQLSLKETLFSKAAILCAEITTFSPYSRLSEIIAGLKRLHVDLVHGLVLLSIGRWYIPNDAAWKTFSPLELATTVVPETAPAFYISAGLLDYYGTYEGSEAFAKLLQTRGIDVAWRPLYADHCHIDVKSVADFLVRTP